MNTNNNAIKQAWLFSVISYIINGFTPFLTKAALTMFHSSLMMVFVRWIITAVFLFIYGHFFINMKRNHSLFSVHWLFFAFMGGISVITSFIYNIAMEYGSSIHAGLISYSRPIMGVILGIIILKESNSIKKLLLIPLLVIGFLFVSDFSFSSSIGRGDLLMLLWSFLSALGLVLIKMYLKKSTEKNMSTYAMSIYPSMFSAIFLSPILISNTAKEITISWQGILGIVGISIVVGCFFNLLQWKALEQLSVSDINIISCISPVITIIIGYFFLGEKMNVQQIIGGFCIFIAVILTMNINIKNIFRHRIEENNQEIS